MNPLKPFENVGSDSGITEWNAGSDGLYYSDKTWESASDSEIQKVLKSVTSTLKMYDPDAKATVQPTTKGKFAITIEMEYLIPVRDKMNAMKKSAVLEAAKVKSGAREPQEAELKETVSNKGAVREQESMTALEREWFGYPDVTSWVDGGDFYRSKDEWPSKESGSRISEVSSLLNVVLRTYGLKGRTVFVTDLPNGKFAVAIKKVDEATVIKKIKEAEEKDKKVTFDLNALQREGIGFPSITSWIMEDKENFSYSKEKWSSAEPGAPIWAVLESINSEFKEKYKLDLKATCMPLAGRFVIAISKDDVNKFEQAVDKTKASVVSKEEVTPSFIEPEVPKKTGKKSRVFTTANFDIVLGRLKEYIKNPKGIYRIQMINESIDTLKEKAVERERQIDQEDVKRLGNNLIQQQIIMKLEQLKEIINTPDIELYDNDEEINELLNDISNFAHTSLGFPEE